MISFTCKCGKSYNVPPEYAGKKVRCKKCHDIMHIPSLAQASSKQIKMECTMCHHSFLASEPKQGESTQCPNCSCDVFPPEAPGIKISCSKCKRQYKAPLSLLGQGEQCPYCSTWNKVEEPQVSNNGLHLEGPSISESETSYQLKKETKDCLLCGEEILETAKKCKHCGGAVVTNSPYSANPSKNKRNYKGNSDRASIFDISFERFLSLEVLRTAYVIYQIIWCIVCLLMAAVCLINDEFGGIKKIGALLGSIVICFLGAVFIRLLFEWWILPFKINENLTEIKNRS